MRETAPEDKKMMKRIASLDFQRGLAIWMMVFLHVFAWSYDISWADDVDSLFGGGVPIFFVIIAVLLGFLGGWAGYFLLISANVNALAMTKRAYKGQKPETIMVKQILTGFGVLIAGRFTEAFMKNGWIGYVIRSGEPIFQVSTWLNPWHWRTVWSRFFIMETLQTIGWCMIINGLIHYFIIRKEGYKKFKRNLFIYLGLTISVLALTPVLHWVASDVMQWPNTVDPELMEFLGVPHSSEYHNTWPSEHLQAANASFKSYIMTVLTGDLEPLFPYLATSFIGSMFGLALAEPKPSKKIPFWAGIGTLAILVAGIIATLIMGFNFTLERPDLAYYLLLLFGQVGFMSLLLWRVEFKGNATKFGNNLVVRYFRRWGIIALTIFSLQIFHWAPKAIFNRAFPNRNLITDVFGDPSLGLDPFAAKEIGFVFLFAFITIVFYEILLILWSRINFFLSWEWIIIRFTSLGTKEVSQRLDYKKIMNDVEWISYKDDT